MKKVFLFFFAAVFAAFGTSACSTDNGIKVMSYNIRMGVAKDGDNSWQYRCPATIAMLQAVRPDVFGVQEAYDFQVAYIDENMPVYKSVGVGREDGKSEGEHMSIFYDTTKVSLLDWGTYWLSETPDVPSKGWGAACKRTATWAKLKLNATGKEFFYVNTHLDHVSDLARKNGLALVVNEIAKMNPDGYPMVLTGDFNITPDSDNLVDLNKIMKSARNTAATTGTKGSYNGYGRSDSEIDYIYYSGFGKCTTFTVHDEDYLGIPYISDHYPISATLEW